MTSAETASRTTEEVALAYFDAIGDRDVQALAAQWKPGSVDHIHGMVDLGVPDELKSWFGNLFEAMPDFKLEVLEMVIEADKAAVRWRATGTLNGSSAFEGIAPNGASLDTEGCDLLTVEDGLIVDNRAYQNGMHMARELGVMPPAGSLGERAMLGANNAKTAVANFIRERRERGSEDQA